MVRASESDQARRKKKILPWRASTRAHASTIDAADRRHTRRGEFPAFAIAAQIGGPTTTVVDPAGAMATISFRRAPSSAATGSLSFNSLSPPILVTHFNVLFVRRRMTNGLPLMLGLFGANVLTPGASFILTVSNAMIHGRRAGLVVAMGLVSSDVVFAVLAMTGLAALVSHDTLAVKAVTLIGGMWFVYSGTRQIFRHNAAQRPQQSRSNSGSLPKTHAWRVGFSAGASNVQAILFFASIFAAAFSKNTHLHDGGFLVLAIAAVSAAARASIVLLFTMRPVMRHYIAQQRKVQTVSGSMIALFGMKLAIPAAFVIVHAMLT
ncbi:LysE family transporter [Burkholderia dolosa]|uniref:LysE family transporter n=1 Tax=Burkholderia dolosa TaxID=152500 RepID=UPI001B976951|nr:LysE family transporter [Burkholderia dolosa]MBR8299741.1 LysE family transporter [Burkholderia dolosa]MBR8460285.1 LysE family transporter [Burkholderia dolosa]MBY4834210.1 LysE family transporter [Burkholderia dolosa]MDN7421332.1 LysE family transporter [Burkholderia dolosa]